MHAAITIADAEGLPAVSLRNVGGALGVAPMRLYGYIGTKEELLDLMADEIYGEMVAMGPISGDWHAVLRSVAQRVRQAWQTHRWFIGLLGGRPHLGPNALVFTEACCAALEKDGSLGDIDCAMQELAAHRLWQIDLTLYRRHARRCRPCGWICRRPG